MIEDRHRDQRFLEAKHEHLQDSIQKRQLAAQELLRKIDREQAMLLKLAVTESDATCPSQTQQDYRGSVLREEQVMNNHVVQKNPMVHQGVPGPRKLSRGGSLELGSVPNSGAIRIEHMSRGNAYDASSKTQSQVRFSVSSSPALSANGGPHQNMAEYNDRGSINAANRDDIRIGSSQMDQSYLPEQECCSPVSGLLSSKEGVGSCTQAPISNLQSEKNEQIERQQSQNKFQSLRPSSHRSSQNTTARHLTGRQTSTMDKSQKNKGSKTELKTDLEIPRQRNVIMSHNVKIKDMSYMPALMNFEEPQSDLTRNAREEIQRGPTFEKGQDLNQLKPDPVVSVVALDHLEEKEIQISPQIKSFLKAEEQARVEEKTANVQPVQRMGSRSRVYQAQYKCNNLEQLNAMSSKTMMHPNNSMTSSSAATSLFLGKRNTQPLLGKVLPVGPLSLAAASEDQSTSNDQKSSHHNRPSHARGQSAALADSNVQISRDGRDGACTAAMALLRQSFDSGASNEIRARMEVAASRPTRTPEDVGGGLKGTKSIQKSDTGLPVSIFGANGRSFLSESHQSGGKGTRNEGALTLAEEKETFVTNVHNLSYALNLTYSVAAASGENNQSRPQVLQSNSLSNHLCQSKGDEGSMRDGQRVSNKPNYLFAPKTEGSNMVYTNMQMKDQCKFLDRLVVFERSKQLKLAAARALKDKQEQEELTFMPKLIAKGGRASKRLDKRRKSAAAVMTNGPKKQLKPQNFDQRRQSQHPLIGFIDRQLKESIASTIHEEQTPSAPRSPMSCARSSKVGELKLSELADLKVVEENEATARLNAIRDKALMDLHTSSNQVLPHEFLANKEPKKTRFIKKKEKPSGNSKNQSKDKLKKSLTTHEFKARIVSDEVFKRLHADRYRMTSKIKEQQRQRDEQEREMFFKPKINMSQVAVRKSLNGRRRQSADVYSKPLLDIKRHSQQMLSLNRQDIDMPSKFDYAISDLQRGAKLLARGRYRSHSNPSDGRKSLNARSVKGRTQPLNMSLLNCKRFCAKSQALVSPKDGPSVHHQAITDHHLVDSRSCFRNRSSSQIQDLAPAVEQDGSLSHGRGQPVNAATSELFVSDDAYSHGREAHGKSRSLGAGRRQSQGSRASRKERQRRASAQVDAFPTQAQNLIASSPSGRALNSTQKKRRQNSCKNVFEFLRRDAVRRLKKWTYLTSEQYQREIALHQAAKFVRRSKSVSSKEPECRESELKALLGHKARVIRHSEDLYRRAVLREIDLRLAAFAKSKQVRYAPDASVLTPEELEAAELEQGGFAMEFSVEQYKEYLFQQKLLTGGREYRVDRHCRTHAAMQTSAQPSRAHSSQASRQPSQACSQRSSASRMSAKEQSKPSSLALRSYCNTDRVLFKKMIKLLTPFGSMNPVLTYRNVRALMYIIVNKFEPWMNERDAAEDPDAATSTYRRKIWKYSMFLKNLKQPTGEALAKCSYNDDAELVDGLPKSKQLRLKEHEREAYVVRDTQLKTGVRAKFYRLSLCVDEQAVQALSSKVFSELARPLLNYIMTVMRQKKLTRGEQTWSQIRTGNSQGKGEVGTDLQRLSAFKGVSQEDRERCEVQRRQFIEMSNRKQAQEPNSHSKSKSGEKRLERARLLRQLSREKVRSIIRNNSQDSIEDIDAYSRQMMERSRVGDHLQQNTLQNMFPSFAPYLGNGLVQELYQKNDAQPPSLELQRELADQAARYENKVRNVPSLIIKPELVAYKTSSVRGEGDSGTLRSYQIATISRRNKDTRRAAPIDRTKPKSRRTFMDSYKCQQDITDEGVMKAAMRKFGTDIGQKENCAPKLTGKVFAKKLISTNLIQKKTSLIQKKPSSSQQVTPSAFYGKESFDNSEKTVLVGESSETAGMNNSTGSNGVAGAFPVVSTAQLIQKQLQLCAFDQQ